MRKRNTELQVINVWWKDITLWTNVIAIAALVLNSQFGIALTPEIQASIIAILNVVLKIPRMATTQTSATQRNKRAIVGGKSILLNL
jgi:hypothetical protein